MGLWNGKGRVRLVRVPNRTTRTMMAVIARYCAPGRVVHSDGWAAYKALPQQGFEHDLVVHEENYVDPTSGVHTQRIERQ